MPLGIYVQVPFCQTKCTYCNFHTGPAARSLYAPYTRAVAREIREHRALHSAAGVGQLEPPATAGDAPDSPDSRDVADTVYIGGGTPSLLDPADLVAILDAVRADFCLSANAEM